MPLEVRNITHIYSEGLPDESVALKDVSFFLEDNAFLGIIGHTGSGKSTLLQHLNGLLKPKTGSIVVNGVDITEPKRKMVEIRKKIGLMFQYPEYQLFEETVAKDVAFGPKNLGLSEEEIDRRVKEALELTGLAYSEVAEKSPFELSGGQKRRVAIAGILAMKPEILILDEPTAGLDPKARKDLLTMIRRVHEEAKNTTILVSHNMNDVAEYADKVLVMDRAQVFLYDTPDKVFAKAEELQSIGLDVPDTTALMQQLRGKGISVAQEGFAMEDAADAIVKALKVSE